MSFVDESTGVASASEAHLGVLANRAFLAPWAITNPFRKAGKELTDLLVPFGDDILVFSDKACRFDVDKPLDLAWSRWKRAAIDEGVKQLAGAIGRLEHPDGAVFRDRTARTPLGFPIPPPARRRYHLINIARPALDPQARPPEWRGLTWSDQQAEAPFVVGPRFIGGRFVHVFDGQDFDLLLDHLDTAPDLIQYLASREALLSGGPGLTFAEPDMLAVATLNWMSGRGFTVNNGADDRGAIQPGAWNAYATSERAALSEKASRPSYAIDRLVGEFHTEHVTQRTAAAAPTPGPAHEHAMRLLACESRFARRMIVSGLESILKEADQSTFWISTVPSPTAPEVRYLWMTYPEKPEGLADDVFTEVILRHLRQNLIVAADSFPAERIFVGLAWPNASANDTLLVITVLDAADRGPEFKAEAEHLRRQGVLSALEAEHSLHMP